MKLYLLTITITYFHVTLDKGFSQKRFKHTFVTQIRHLFFVVTFAERIHSFGDRLLLFTNS